ncbi:hypothetical protein AAG906_007395 [Vitis piasezkii]
MIFSDPSRSGDQIRAIDAYNPHHPIRSLHVVYVPCKVRERSLVWVHFRSEGKMIPSRGLIWVGCRAARKLRKRRGKRRRRRGIAAVAAALQTEEDGRGEEGSGGGARGTPSTKEAIKDMALKFSGAYRQCKPCTGSSSYKKGHRPYPDFDTISEGVPYPYLRPGSSSSTPAWDFTTSSHNPGAGSDSRFTGVLRGDQTPGGVSISAQSCDVVLEDEDEPKEWMAQVEPGVHITFVREMFNKWQAQRWWGENYDRIMELYNVQRFNRQALHTPPRSEDERDSSYSRMGSARESPMTPSLNKEWIPRNYYKPPGSKGYFPSEPSDQYGSHQYNAGSSAYGTGGPRGETSSMDASRTTTSSRDEASVSISNASDMETEWVEQDEPGVYITIRQLADGTRSFKRQIQVHAKTWWEENRERIQAQYL